MAVLPQNANTGADLSEIAAHLRGLIGDPAEYSAEELHQIITDHLSAIPDPIIFSAVPREGAGALVIPGSPLEQALELDPKYRVRSHLQYISDRMVAAVRDVEEGRNRLLRVSIGPRLGKSILTSQYLPFWLLRQHPDWKIGMVSYSDGLAVSWGRGVRRLVEQHPDMGVVLASDLASAAEWQTTSAGGVVSRGINSGYTGIGFRVLFIDDPVKGTAEAHSKTYRNAIWERWVADLYSRLEPPYLVVVIGTRFHEDDFIGRLASKEYAGNPDDWEVIELPVIATSHDVLGRQPGEPLYSPLLEETEEEAVARWAEIKANVGSYVFAALYDQRPAPATGAIFNADWWRYWTTNPANVSVDGGVVYLDPALDLAGARWLDSWDCAFKGTDSSDYVVGQRWARLGPNRYLIAQQRERLSFTQTIAAMQRWTTIDQALNPYGAWVHERRIEEKANGAAVIDVLREQVSGLKPVSPKDSKEVRARAITPEIESGHVYLPYPGDPGNAWVAEALDELRDFPHAANDDVVDALTQALAGLRDEGFGMITVPTRHPVGQSALAAPITQRRRTPSRGVAGIRVPR